MAHVKKPSGARSPKIGAFGLTSGATVPWVRPAAPQMTPFGPIFGWLKDIALLMMVKLVTARFSAPTRRFGGGLVLSMRGGGIFHGPPLHL
jgi:hypothetical protein